MGLGFSADPSFCWPHGLWSNHTSSSAATQQWSWTIQTYVQGRRSSVIFMCHKQFLSITILILGGSMSKLPSSDLPSRCAPGARLNWEPGSSIQVPQENCKNPTACAFDTAFQGRHWQKARRRSWTWESNPRTRVSWAWTSQTLCPALFFPLIPVSKRTLDLVE